MVAGPEQGVCSVPQEPVPPSLALWILQQYWLQGQIPGIGACVFWRQGPVLADTLGFFLPPQATGPFLHIGAVGGMTLLAWPLASFIYRTHSTGNGPPRSPLVPLAGALPPATHLSSTVGRCSGSISAVGTGLQCGSNACSWLRLMTSPCCSFSPPCLAAEGGIQVAECCRSAELGKGM